MGKIRVGIIGTGYTVGIAMSHIKAYQAIDDAEITAYYDIIPGRAEQFLKDHGVSGGQICSSLNELLGKVDAISICLPNNRHMETAKAALDAGKHFICEKPLATSWEEGKKFVDYFNGHKNKVVAMMGFHLRNSPHIRYIKQILDEGKIGRIYSVIQQTGGSRIADPIGVKREWRMDRQQSGAGAIPDFGSHMLDLACYLLSEQNGRICRVQCFKNTFITERPAIDGSGNLPVTNDDAAVFSAMTDKGTLCSFYTCRIGMPYTAIHITGDGGMLCYDNRNNKKLGIQLKDKKGGYASPMEYKDIPPNFFDMDGHKGLALEFINTIKSGKWSNYSRNVEHGLYIQYLLDKVDEAADKGCSITVD